MSLLAPLEATCSAILISVHSALVDWGFASAGGGAWALSIVALVLFIRLALLPLGIRQARAQQRMRALAPHIDAVRKRPHDSKRHQQEAVAALFREHGVSPFATIVPALVQAPVLFALFRLLNSLGGDNPLGWFAQHPALALSAATAPLWGAALSATLRSPGPMASRLVILLVIGVTVMTTYLSTRHSVTLDAAPAADAMAARLQQLLPYLVPVGLAAVAVTMPLGVLLFWCSSAVFGYAQQHGVRRWITATG